MKLPTFEEFINLKEEYTSGAEIDDQVTKRGHAMAKLEKEKEDNKDLCPRCNQSQSSCECDSEDYYSTKNIYKLPKGKEFKKK